MESDKSGFFPLKKKQRVPGAQVIDTSVGIWEHLFRVKVTLNGLRGEASIRQSGTLMSGIKAIDNDAANRETVTYMSIDKMLDLYRDNITIKVCNPADTKKIYDNISDHLQMWRHQLARGVNVGNAPIEDLIDLDRFANTVYEHARYQFIGDTEMDNIIAKHFSNVTRVGAHNFFNAGALHKFQYQGKNVTTTDDGTTVINGSEKPETPERDSFGDFFKERMLGTMGRRNQ